MTLREWQDNGWLEPRQPDARRIADMLAVADRDLTDCTVAGLSADARFGMAYNAALQSAAAALAVSGFRATRDSHHYRIIQSLALTIEQSADVVGRLDRARKKRNIADYDRPDVASDREANEMYELASGLRREVAEWLTKEHPELAQG